MTFGALKLPIEWRRQMYMYMTQSSSFSHLLIHSFMPSLSFKLGVVVGTEIKALSKSDPRQLTE